MGKAGFCSECGQNVYLTPEGKCAHGHGAECVSGVYDVPDVAPATAVAGPGAAPLKKPFYRKWWFWVLVVLLLMGMCSALGGGKTTSSDKPAPSKVSVAATAPASSPAQESTSVQAAVATAPEAPAPVEPAPVKPAPIAKPVYKSLSARAFKLLSKNPDNYIGDTYIIYGEITQFDSATGTDTFRADTGPKKLRITYGFVNYSQNSILTGDEGMLSKLVEGDVFKAKVTVLGSYSYDTQIGGNTTVPSFQVDSISRYGSTS